MDLTSPTTIKHLLAKHHAKPQKTMGQNFLIDKRYLAKIIAAANVQPHETVVEIGPGLGVLTRELAQKAARVIAIEKDRTMVAILQETLKSFTNIEVIHEDALTLDPKRYTLDASPYKVVANIPYYITSPLIRKFLEAAKQPSVLILMVQKEVAQRICAKAPDMNMLAVSVQFYAEPNIVSYVPKGCFWPSPNVDSAIIQITPQKNPNHNINPEAFFNVVKAGFLHPRKKLINNLTEGLTIEKGLANAWLIDNAIDPSRRAETLGLEDWKNLAKSAPSSP